MSTDDLSDSTTPPTQSPNEEPARPKSLTWGLDLSKLGEGRPHRKLADQKRAKEAEEAKNAEEARIAAEASKRLCLDLPVRTHLRFKKACVSTNRKMTTELLTFIKQRIVELEKEALELDNAAKKQDAMD